MELSKQGISLVSISFIVKICQGLEKLRIPLPHLYCRGMDVVFAGTWYYTRNCKGMYLQV